MYRYFYLILLQVILLSSTAFGFTFIHGWMGFKSVLLGGSAWFIPSTHFLWRIQKIKLTFGDIKLLKYFFSSEIIKLLLSFGMVTLILLTCYVDKESFLSGYIIMVLISLIIPLRYGMKK